jgi:acyl-CoA dehydrogenase
MNVTPHAAWPFFDEPHRQLVSHARAFAAASLASATHPHDCNAVDQRCRDLVATLGAAGLTRYCVRAADGGALPEFDARAICLVRETLAWWDGLADFAFAMQGLGSGALSLAGSDALRARYLPRVARGEAIAAFALSEPDAGSDVAAMQCSARLDGDCYVLDGVKTWISNGGIADFYCVFARTSPGVQRADGTTEARGISAFVVEPGDPGFAVESRIDVIAPHPLATLRFSGCRIPVARRIGVEGEGFKIAMRTLDVFRTSVAAAALGFAQRALDEAVQYVKSRRMFGQTLGDFQLTQAALADMATSLEAARLLAYRAAWLRDHGQPVTQAAAMAKMTATENAQSVIDRALQMFGGRGVVSGEILERLYREIRALRIYEGATEVQKLIIGRELLK